MLGQCLNFAVAPHIHTRIGGKHYYDSFSVLNKYLLKVFSLFLKHSTCSSSKFSAKSIGVKRRFSSVGKLSETATPSPEKQVNNVFMLLEPHSKSF